MTRPALYGGHRPGTATHTPALGDIANPGWMDAAACPGHWREMDPADIDPATGKQRSYAQKAWLAALAIVRYCEQCPVINQCEQLRRQQASSATGVWAGMWLTGQPGPHNAKQHPPVLLARRHLAGEEVEIPA